MFQLFLVRGLLGFELVHFALGFSQGGLLALEVVGLLVYDSVEVVDASQRLGDVVLNSSDSGC